MKWQYGIFGLIVLLMLGCVAPDFRFDEVKLLTDSFPFIIDTDPVVHLTLNRITYKEFLLSKTVISYDYVFVHAYDSSSTKFILQELIIDIPKDTTFYYIPTGIVYSYGGKSITEYAKFCNIPYDDLLEMSNAPTTTVYMCGTGYTLQTGGKVFGLKEWLERVNK